MTKAEVLSAAKFSSERASVMVSFGDVDCPGLYGNYSGHDKDNPWKTEAKSLSGDL